MIGTEGNSPGSGKKKGVDASAITKSPILGGFKSGPDTSSVPGPFALRVFALTPLSTALHGSREHSASRHDKIIGDIRSVGDYGRIADDDTSPDDDVVSYCHAIADSGALGNKSTGTEADLVSKGDVAVDYCAVTDFQIGARDDVLFHRPEFTLGSFGVRLGGQGLAERHVVQRHALDRDDALTINRRNVVGYGAAVAAAEFNDDLAVRIPCDRRLR